MNNKLVSFLKNCSYSIASNLISLVISIIVIFIVPKNIGVEQYGYWQLYIFYTSYAGFFHLGWIEGFYLKYGGKQYADLDKCSFTTQFWLINLIELGICVCLATYVFYFVEDIEQMKINFMVILNILIIIAKTFLTYILLSVNQIQKYAILILFERLVSFCLIILILFMGVQNYQPLIIVDTVAKLFALMLVTYYCSDIVFGKLAPMKLVLPEVYANISIGSKIMFANIAGMLILGTVRFGIEWHWGVEVFGKVSMALGISNLFMVFIGAVNIVLFPLLKKTSLSRLPNVYEGFRSLLMMGILGLLVLYYPGTYLLSIWLPAYQESYVYMALLFPICVYEGKWSMLIYTYLKVLRKEKWILYINLAVVFISVLLTWVMVFLFENLMAAIGCILFLSAFRSAFSELLLSMVLRIHVIKDILFEIVLSLIFILTAWLMPAVYGITIYAGAYLIYLCIIKSRLKTEIKAVTEFIKNS